MLLTSMLALAQASAPELSYHVEIRASEGAPAQVHMTLEVEGDSDGSTDLILPTEWGGEWELWTGIADITVDGGTLSERPGEPARRTIAHQPGAPLTVSWQVVQDREGIPTAVADDNYRPWLQETYVHMLGQTVFLRPERDANPLAGDSLTRVRFEVTEGWALASDLQRDHLPLNDLNASVIIAGDFRITTLDIEGAPVRVAARGSINDAQILAATEAAVRGNLAYWSAEGEPYLVTALPIEVQPGRSSFGGTNLADAFAIFGTDNVPEDILVRILVHEHSHSWVPNQLGALTQGSEQPADYWFSEGFTDFVTTRAGLLSGAWDAQGAIAQWNEFMGEYMASPAREAPNTSIRDGFWTSRDHQRLPYLRGNMFAALIDHRIYQETGGAQDLDDVLFAMRDAPEKGLAVDSFLTAVPATTGVDIEALYQRHIIDGETIYLPADTFGACGTVETGMQPVFVYGMTLGANPDGEGFLLEDVEPDGPAARAGFEVGMVMLERVAGSVGDATQESAFRMIDLNGEERVMSYLPTNGEMEEVQRLVPAEGDLAANGCAERLAGRPL